MDLSNNVPRSDSINNLGDSVFGRLIAKIGAEEDQRFPGLGGDPSLAKRFCEARNAAREVVAEGALKPAAWQCEGRNIASICATVALRRCLFSGICVVFKLSPTSLNGLDWSETILRGWIKNRNAQGTVGIETDEDALKDRLREIRNRRIAPSKELVAALLWTSAHLPLCLMKSSAAADAVPEILLSLDGVKHPEDLDFEETVRKRFLQSFRVMTGERCLKYFDETLTGRSQPAEIITGVVGKVAAGQVAEAAPKAGRSDA